MIQVEIFQIILNALFTGFGTALGAYLANRHLIKRIERAGDEKDEDKGR